MNAANQEEGDCERGVSEMKAGHMDGNSNKRTSGVRTGCDSRRRLSAVFLGCVASHTGKDPAYRRESPSSTSPVRGIHVFGSPSDGSATIRVTTDKWRRLSKSLLVLTLRKRTNREDREVGGGRRVTADKKGPCSSPETHPCPLSLSSQPTSTVLTPGRTQDAVGDTTCSVGGEVSVVERVKLRHARRSPPHARPTSCPNLHLNPAKKLAGLDHLVAPGSDNPIAETNDGKYVCLRERPSSLAEARSIGVHGHHWPTLQLRPKQNIVTCFFHHFHRPQLLPLDLISDDAENVTSYCISTDGTYVLGELNHLGR